MSYRTMTLVRSARSSAWALLSCPSHVSRGGLLTAPTSANFRPRSSEPWWRRPVTWSPFDQPLPAHASCFTFWKRAAPDRDDSPPANPNGASSSTERSPHLCSSLPCLFPVCLSALRPSVPILCPGLSRSWAVCRRLRTFFCTCRPCPECLPSSYAPHSPTKIVPTLCGLLQCSTSTKKICSCLP